MSWVNSHTLRTLVIFVAIAGLVSVGACSTKSDKEAGGNGGSAGGNGAGGANDPEGQAPIFSADGSSPLSDIYFDFDSSDIRAGDRELLNAHAEWMKSNAGVQVQIEGHCDERGTEEYNLALGESRANTVKDYLSNLGVDSSRLYTISYGEELPADPGSSEGAWAKNRRAHFLVTGQ